MKFVFWFILWMLNALVNAIGSNERMGGSVVDFIGELERAGDLTKDQAQFIVEKYPDADESDRYSPLLQQSESVETALQDDMIAYLDEEEANGNLAKETKLYVSTLLHLQVDNNDFPDPVPGNYDGNGIVELLGRSRPHLDSILTLEPNARGYMGIWAYAVGSREYALIGHSVGLYIVDITNPASSFRVQLIPMDGGSHWRDVETYTDNTSGKTYAYVAAQADGNLFVVDLSHLSHADPDTVDGAECPYKDLGYKNFGHTLSVRGDFLILNTAGFESRGCQIFDLKADPWNPTLFSSSYSGTQRDCHDSDVLFGATVPGFTTPRDLLFSADGFTAKYRTVDITDMRAGKETLILGQTATSSTSNTYAHSLALSEDSQYMYAFEETNKQDIRIYDISNPLDMTLVRTFSYSNDAIQNAIVHNGHVRGGYLFVAYYEAGFRVFDISDPIDPVEVGKYETYLDPDGTGESSSSQIVTGSIRGAWNLYPHLPSGNIVVTDQSGGLFILRIKEDSPPVSPTCVDATGWNTIFDCGVLETFGCSVESFLLGKVDGISGQKACCSCGGGVK